MTDPAAINWMIYGATGYTGNLVIAAAVRRGHRPVIAGRNAEKLMPLAARYDLDYRAFSLDDVNAIAEAIADMQMVYHAAGPFIHTAKPMIKACLATHTHYLDITGEIEVFERTFSYDDVASSNGIALITGAGFDVVPTDCLAVYVANQVNGATRLQIGLAGFNRASAGTAKSFLEMVPDGGRARQNGQLKTVPLGNRTLPLRLSCGEFTGMSIPWGDLSTAYRSTGIPDIETYMAVPGVMATLTRLTAPVGRVLLSLDPVRQAAASLLEMTMRGPSARARETVRTCVWARAENDAGEYAEAWLETVEPYRFTAEIAIAAIEALADTSLSGVLTPALAFGADFVLNVNETTRMDTLEA